MWEAPYVEAERRLGREALSCCLDLSWEQEQIAKSVTNKCSLLSVLVFSKVRGYETVMKYKCRFAEGRKLRENLQMVLIGRFCKFQKSKTVNYHMQMRVGANRWGAGTNMSH